MSLAQSAAESNNALMIDEEMLDKTRTVRCNCSLEEFAERIEFMAAVQTGLDQPDRGAGIPHDVKRQLASWLT